MEFPVIKMSKNIENVGICLTPGRPDWEIVFFGKIHKQPKFRGYFLPPFKLLFSGLCFDTIISLYFWEPKITTIDIGAKRKRHFLYLLKNLQKNY
jgi:hypothetical protein